MTCRGIYRGGPLGHGPPLAKKIFFWHTKKFGKLGLAPLCVSTSGQQKFGPPFFEILNTPLMTWCLRVDMFSIAAADEVWKPEETARRREEKDRRQETNAGRGNERVSETQTAIPAERATEHDHQKEEVGRPSLSRREGPRKQLVVIIPRNAFDFNLFHFHSRFRVCSSIILVLKSSLGCVQFNTSGASRVGLFVLMRDSAGAYEALKVNKLGTKYLVTSYAEWCESNLFLSVFQWVAHGYINTCILNMHYFWWCVSN